MTNYRLGKPRPAFTLPDNDLLHFRSDMTVELIDHMGNDESITRAAKISTAKDREVSACENATSGLINFLMKNRHGTPFEHNAMTFRIEAPIFVFREFHRHRIGWSYNEESGRYTQLKPVFYIPDRSRNLVQVGKPGHYTFTPGTERQHDEMAQWVTEANVEAYQAYWHALNFGIAREVARICLPVNIYSSMYATCNARSLMAFLSLRTKAEHATFPSFPQREIEMVAEQMETAFGDLFPVTQLAFTENGRVAP